MPDHVALDESPLIMPGRSKYMHLRIARYISNILSPMTISLPLVTLAALYHEHNSPLKVAGHVFLTLLFVSIGPLLYILIGVRKGKFTDLDVSVRTQRNGPFLFMLISTLLGLFLLSLIHAPRNLQTLLIIAIFGGLVLMITTHWWKISIHAASMGVAVTFLTALYGIIVLPAYLLVVLVGWSRVVLRHHTVAQVIAGSLVSIALSAIVLVVRGI
ncbi:hypothetical protein EPA93_37370 [Ktedonosporobacter rubrisoli]|uniref:Phosphatase PAP2 family protein n=1 Tax=Ktedonosporobacter rubrisoli TaxID=2509675 RepID=A0A4P6JZZ6_KTERU|nr:hypothetical protein [Ktedonosporobacter rubrisoli]QBD81344.1 hypothetical protein EPA93_37370 [Ktedonosporobacter rubrisoli]